MNYQPKTPFLIKMFFAEPTKIEITKGVPKKIYGKYKPFHCSFRTFGGSEKVINGVLSVEDTAIIEMWYRPDITSDCRIKDVRGKEYEVLGTPENIEGANKILKFKIRAIKGGA